MELNHGLSGYEPDAIPLRHVAALWISPQYGLEIGL